MVTLVLGVSAIICFAAGYVTADYLRTLFEGPPPGARRPPSMPPELRNCRQCGWRLARPGRAKCPSCDPNRVSN